MGRKRRQGRLRTERLDPYRLLIPRQGAMRAEGLVYASAASAGTSLDDGSLAQVANVAALPGLVGRALAMPDVHQGYGFPIGGVAAFDPAAGGVVSPGGVGYDINCGVRLYRTRVPAAAVSDRLEPLLNRLFNTIPTGVGAGRTDNGLSKRELRAVLAGGAAWAVKQGYGEQSELAVIEEQGCLQADPEALSKRALERGRRQLGSLGSGNHFIELGRVAEIFDPTAAAAFGLAEGALTIMVHTGSRGLGHQVCDDQIRLLDKAASRYGIELPDRQLACAPVESPEGGRYLDAMGAAANFAFANRQVIGHQVHQALEGGLALSPHELGLGLVYDVCHNIAKLETAPQSDSNPGGGRRLCVHRKGATRALPPGDRRLPAQYLAVGQPVLVPGDMGRASFVLAGRPGSAETFHSACHGAGRVLSRTAALRAAHGRSVLEELGERGIIVRAARRRTLVEEMPSAYRDVNTVAEVVEGAGLAARVARLEPLAVIKG